MTVGEVSAHVLINCAASCGARPPDSLLRHKGPRKEHSCDLGNEYCKGSTVAFNADETTYWEHMGSSWTDFVFIISMTGRLGREVE